MITTTLNQIRDYGPCPEGWATLRKGLGSNFPLYQPFGIASVYEINDESDFTWVLTMIHPKVAVAFALYVAKLSLKYREVGLGHRLLEEAVKALRDSGSSKKLRDAICNDFDWGTPATVPAAAQATAKYLDGTPDPGARKLLWVDVDNAVEWAAIDSHSHAKTFCYICSLLDASDDPETVINALLDQ